MNSTRCMQCGFLNFAAAEVCKRCQAALPRSKQSEASQPPDQGFNPYWNNEANQWGFPPGADIAAPPVKPTGGKVQIAIIGLVILAAYALRVYLFVDAVKGCAPKSMAYELGRFTGYLLIAGLVCYLIWRFLLGKNNRRQMMNLFIVAVVALSAWQIQNELNAQWTTKETIRRLMSKNASAADGDGFMKKDTAPYPSGRFDKVARTYEDALVDIHNQSMAYIIDRNKVQPLYLLDPVSISQFPDIKLKRQELADHLASINRHEAAIKQLVKETIDKLSAAHIEGCIEREFVDGARGGLKMMRDVTSEYFSIERDYFQQADKMLALLEEKGGHYSLKNGSQIVFSSEADTLLFGFLMDNLKQANKRQEEWERRTAEKSAKHMQGLQSFAQ